MEVLTCGDNKKQQAGVELHFQSSDIAGSETLGIPNPYADPSHRRCPRVRTRTSDPRAPKNDLQCPPPPYERTSEASQTFLLHHFLLTEHALLVEEAEGGGFGGTQRRTVPQMGCRCPGRRAPLRGTDGGVLSPPFKRRSPKMRGRNPASSRRSWFLRAALKRSTGSLLPQKAWRHERAAGGGRFIRAVTSAPPCVPGGRMVIIHYHSSRTNIHYTAIIMAKL